MIIDISNIYTKRRKNINDNPQEMGYNNYSKT